MSNPIEPLTRAERRAREATYPKCKCGNVAGLGQVECSRCREIDQWQSFNRHEGAFVSWEVIERVRHFIEVSGYAGTLLAQLPTREQPQTKERRDE